MPLRPRVLLYYSHNRESVLYTHLCRGIGNNVKIGPGALIAHGCDIKDDVIIHGGARLAGFVKVGSGARIGMGACIRNRMEIGAGAIVSVGAVVVCDVPPGEIWAGNPATKLRDVTQIERRIPSSYVI